MLLLASVSAFGQSSVTGTLTGTVTSDGAPLPGATITVTSPQLQGSRTAVSDANGNYNIAALPPGDYTVRIELQGLQTVTRSTRVTLAGTSRVDADLKVSAVTESITV
ncbi:MAG TPA: carboxypeptidase-like regulatory domain-containing protein, partial [Thermoanaerobaculia bacterium]|nr:carboxypeptidase-like regulatory domain-containing protein [Thermoanaerobaculia bacterium]